MGDGWFVQVWAKRERCCWREQRNRKWKVCARQVVQCPIALHVWAFEPARSLDDYELIEIRIVVVHLEA
jgi:hypothetical protein